MGEMYAVDKSKPFPENLLVFQTRELTEREREMDGWRPLHNRAVIEWHKSTVGAMADVRTQERGLLAVMAGIDQLAGSWAAQWDPVSGEALWSIVNGFTGLLSHDLGRLMGGVLSEWATDVCARVGVDVDTAEWIGGN